MKVTISLKPTTDEIIKWAKDIETKVLSNYSQFWEKKAVTIVQNEVANVFVTQGRGTWQALSPRYARRKAKTHPGKTILRRTDKYFKSASNRRSSGNVFSFDANSMTYGIDPLSFMPAPYPIFHELGTRKMPARPVWKLASRSEMLRTRLTVSLRSYLRSAIKAMSKGTFNV